MVHNGLPIEQLESITPTDVRTYAQAKGWTRVAAAQGSALIFKYPGTDLDQLLVPKSQRSTTMARTLPMSSISLPRLRSTGCFGAG